MHSHRQSGHHGYRAAANAVSKRFLRRWDVAWVRMPQMLTSVHDTNGVDSKVRPFVVMSDAAFDVDGSYRLKTPVTLLGIGCTSKEWLMEDRPHIEFEVPGQKIKSYAFADNLCNVTCPAGSKLQAVTRLPAALAQKLRNDIDAVVKPESGFYLKRRFRGHMPGQVWKIRTHVLSGHGIILLRRGPYVLEQNPGQSSEALPSSGRLKYSPYMVAILRDNAAVGNMLGVTWDKIDIGVVHERALIERTGAEINKETVGIFLDTLRRRIGSPPAAYTEPEFSSAWHLGPALAAFRFLRMGF